MNRFEEYCSSYITPQMTLLEKFNALLDFLKQNKETNLFLSEKNWQDNTNEYNISDVVLGGYELRLFDIILFKNGYYSYVKTIGTEKFTIGDVRYFVGEKGETGTSVLSFSINQNQHLIVNYDNGTSQDLGAIFQGNVNIDGNLTANSIIENMSASQYFVALSSSDDNVELEPIYFGMCKNGNKLTIVYALNVTVLTTEIDRAKYLGQFHIPQSVWEKLYPSTIGSADYLAIQSIKAMSSGSQGQEVVARFVKNLTAYYVQMQLFIPSTFTANVKRYVRIEQTFLLSDNLIS